MPASIVFFFLMIRLAPRPTRRLTLFPYTTLFRSRHPAARRPYAHQLRDRHHRHMSGGPRSEEHTSELQSPIDISYAVFCLKKKKYNVLLHRFSAASCSTKI